MGDGGWGRKKLYLSDIAGLPSSFKHPLDPRDSDFRLFDGRPIRFVIWALLVILLLWTPHTANVW